MIKQIIGALAGKVIWDFIVFSKGIDDNAVVIFLPESDNRWNSLAIRYLPSFMERKKAEKAYVYTIKSNRLEVEKNVPSNREIKVFSIQYEAMTRMLDYYCLHLFSRNVVFFFKDKPSDNRSQFVIGKSPVTEVEYICQGLYKLRGVPDSV